MDSLIKQIEEATFDEVVLFKTAYRILAPDHTQEQHDLFCSLVELGGFVDAAIMLVPQNMLWIAGGGQSPTASIHMPHEEPKIIGAATPALALVAAIISTMSGYSRHSRLATI